MISPLVSCLPPLPRTSEANRRLYQSSVKDKGGWASKQSKEKQRRSREEAEEAEKKRRMSFSQVAMRRDHNATRSSQRDAIITVRRDHHNATPSSQRDAIVTTRRHRHNATRKICQSLTCTSNMIVISSRGDTLLNTLLPANIHKFLSWLEAGSVS